MVTRSNKNEFLIGLVAIGLLVVGLAVLVEHVPHATSELARPVSKAFPLRGAGELADFPDGDGKLVNLTIQEHR